jgi:hypothetical protein
MSEDPPRILLESLEDSRVYNILEQCSFSLLLAMMLAC